MELKDGSLFYKECTKAIIECDTSQHHFLYELSDGSRKYISFPASNNTSTLSYSMELLLNVFALWPQKQSLIFIISQEMIT
jgi:hypothetical protein